MGRYLFGPDERRAVLATLDDRRTRMVTLTITGDAYRLCQDGGALAPDVAADLRRPTEPGTVWGYLAEALDRRRREGRSPFTVLSCDNLPGNGVETREALVGFARMRDERLARWIERHVSFPSSLVDRITPVTTDADREALAARFGLTDRWPVVAEPFRQWIVEDGFCAGRPPLEEAGVRLVGDVAPYTLVKRRLLNGGHCALGYLGHLAGHATTDQAMADPAIRDYMTGLMDEIAALLPAPPGIDLRDYSRTLLARFGNPALGDRLSRLCRRGSTKVPAYLLPSLVEAVQRRMPSRMLSLGVAGWLRYLQARDPSGRPFDIADSRGDRLTALALAGGTDPRPLLGEREVFGDAGDDRRLVASLEHSLQALDRDGPRRALQAVEAPAVAQAA
jgi:fructuronate reductase/mannitol 2-dehydrogenase